jgi:hypothetical protein
MKKQTKKVTKEKDIFDDKEFKAILNEYYDTDIDGDISIKLAYLAGYRNGMNFSGQIFVKALKDTNKKK